MKIKYYFAIIIFACLSCAFLLEHYISDQQHKTEIASNENTSDRFTLVEFSRLQTELYQYFISVDLILGSGETYLVDGAIKKGRLLSKSINTLESYSNLFSNTKLINEVEKKLKNVNELLMLSTKQSDINRSTLLNNLLSQSDEIITLLIEDITELNNSAIINAEKRTNALEDQKRQLRDTRISGAFSFGILLFLLWVWAYKRVCNPLYELKEFAEKSIGNFNNLEVMNEGPKEIIELSNSLSILTNTLSYQATHDSLTQLYNRREFERQLENSISRQDINDSSNKDILCYLDLDQFKIVNDSCGHIAGDELLRLIANTISKEVRRSDFIARVGGDEFCILLYKCSMDSALEISNKIRDEIENIRYPWDDKVFRISASIGLTEIDNKEIDAHEVLNAADTACSVAKDLGRNRVHAFSTTDTQLARKRTEMSCINQIHLALEENRFVLYRQDIITLNNQNHSKAHYEVLIRMISKDGQIISPYAFLPTAERYHLATQLDKWVVSNVFEFLSSDQGEIADLELCNINLSGQSFSNQNMADYIIDKLIETNIPAHKICFEITETAAVTDINNAKMFIGRLKAQGCLFALDDFGSGLSSFQYLKDLPVDFVKIDGAFVKNMDKDNIDMATVRSINDVAKTSGKKTVAEFVENEGIVGKLVEIGVDYAQGYHFSTPVPMIEFNQSDEKISDTQ
jgi:diguanylate cyclase (GGDEF)-like protein